ncbi:MAG TPA: hypothetical protein VGH93_13305, partial [Solirubrobacteraceae bacterium]
MDELQVRREGRTQTPRGRNAQRSQAEHHADAAARKADQRRSKQSGVRGVVAGRAGQWSLEGRDWD